MALRVLIVDDCERMRDCLKVMLDGVVEVIDECADGAEALQAYVKFQPDWVLMDWAMKDVDGIAAVRQITSLFPDAQILMVTSCKDNHLRREAAEAGARGFVPKDDLLSLHSYLM